MEGRKIRSSILALAVAAMLTPLAPAFGAQNQKSGNQQPPAAQQKQQQRIRTYYGTIVKLKNGKYALMIDPKKHRGYFLDDQKDAKKYFKKVVLVTGTVDNDTGILHALKFRVSPH